MTTRRQIAHNIAAVLLTMFFSIGFPSIGNASQTLEKADTIYVNEHSTVHLRFPSKIKYVNIGHRAITARIVEGGMDLAVKAVEEFIFPTSLTCLTSSGHLHAFPVAYGANTPEGEDSLVIEIKEEGDVKAADAIEKKEPETGSPSYKETAERMISEERKTFHLGKYHDGILAECINIVREKDSLYIVTRISNTSKMKFRFSSEYSLSPLRSIGRSALPEKTLTPRWTYGPKEVLPGESITIVSCLGGVYLSPRQSLKVVFLSTDGQRRVCFKIYGKGL